MRKMLFVVFLLLAGASEAQEYMQAAGIRAGLCSGVEYRRFIDYQYSGRILLGARSRGLQLYALLEIHQWDLFSFTDNIGFYYGAGIHGGFVRWSEKFTSGTLTGEKVFTRPVVGIDGFAGLEYNFDLFPLSAGLEMKPAIDFWGRDGFDVIPWDFAFTLRYLF